MHRSRSQFLSRACLTLLVSTLIVSLCPAVSSGAADHPILYLFWGNGCPHCEKAKEYLPQLQAKYPELEMRWFEVWDHEDNQRIAEAMRQAYNIKATSVPMIFLGTWTTTGYLSNETTGKEIEDQIIGCLQNGCIDAIRKLGPRQMVSDLRKQVAQKAPVDWELLAATAPPRKLALVPTPVATTAAQPTSTNNSIASSTSPPTPTPIPKPTPAPKNDLVKIWRWQLSVSQIGLPLFTFIIGFLDGLNPCAMWVLSFLLTLVIHARSRSKILLIGGIFVVASGVIYFIFMVGWLTFYQMKLIRAYATYLRVTVALVAIVMGVINCKDFFFFKQGISLTIPESAQPKLFKKMRALVHTQELLGVIVGTIVLAVTANLIEFGCTAGFPAIYTNILTLYQFTSFQQYMYLAFYNVVYVIPLAVIVSIFAWTMGGRKLTEKEGRILKLIGGVLMLSLGLILLFKPDLLTFGK
jgi:thiol-disulfide isomerase/thioredoxin